eukprot:2345954-Prymnesium_polylepis.1
MDVGAAEAATEADGAAVKEASGAQAGLPPGGRTELPPGWRAEQRVSGNGRSWKVYHGPNG